MVHHKRKKKEEPKIEFSNNHFFTVECILNFPYIRIKPTLFTIAIYCGKRIIIIFGKSCE
jgi:hypothetical protein